MHQRQNTKHSTTGTTQDHYIYFTHGAYWVRPLAPGCMYRRFSILLVITDHITRYTQVYPTRKKEIKITSTKLFDDYILRFGTAGKILPEQGRKFENKLFTHLSKLCNMVEMDMIKLIDNMIDMDMIIDMKLFINIVEMDAIIGQIISMVDGGGDRADN